MERLYSSSFKSLTISIYLFNNISNFYINSGNLGLSSLFNVTPTIFLALAVIPFHFLTILFYYLMPSEVQEGKWKRLKQWITKLMKKLFIMLTFGWYIRYIFETNQYVLISCVYEVFMFNTFDSAHIISLWFAILLWFSWWILIIFVLWLSLSSYEVSEKVHCKLGEVFSGVKMNKKCKFYVSVLLIRRALYVVLLITLNSIQSWLLISILSIIQLWYLVFIIFLRPFANKKDNIIEISNEIFFWALLSSLIFLNTESDWNPAITDIYMWTIALNSMFIFSIMMSK